MIKKCRHGHMMYLPNDLWVGRSLHLYGEWAQQHVSFIEHFIDENSVVVDVGANIGANTIAFARKAKSVVAFEPYDLMYHMLCCNIAINNIQNIKVIKKAAWYSSGKTLYAVAPDPSFYTSEENFAGLFLTELPRYGTDNLPIDTMSIDDLELESCDLLRIDVRGYETQIISGANTLIKRHRPILVINIDHWTIPRLNRFAVEAEYVTRSCRSKIYNPDNFFGNSVDELQDEFTPVSSSLMLAFPKEKQLDEVYFKAMKDIS